MNPKKRKILYVITKGGWGGAQRYVFDLATNLSPTDFDAIVACGQPGMLIDRLKKVGIRTQIVPTLIRDIALVNDIRSFFQLRVLFREEQPDVVHLNSSKAAAIGALVARMARVRHIVFTAHGWPFKEDRMPFAKLILYAATWCTVLLSYATIVVSKEDEKIGKRMWLVKNKIHYIPNAIQAAGLLTRERAEEIVFYPDVDSHIINSIRLVTIAELTKNKGLHYGIDMIKELEKRLPGTYTYTIFGNGEDLPCLQEQTRGLVNSQNQPIVLFRSISTNMPSDLSTEASRYLRAFDIFVLPSIKEGMPYVLLEAAVAGLPIVATHIVREEAATIPNIHFVSPRDGQALASAVHDLKKNAPTITWEAARSFPTMLKRTIALYGVTRC